MCAMEKGQMMSCQLSYYPIDSDNYLEETNEVLSLIQNSGIEYEIGPMSTVIMGEAEKVFSLIEQIHRKMSAADYHYAMDLTLSNICGFVPENNSINRANE